MMVERPPRTQQSMSKDDDDSSSSSSSSRDNQCCLTTADYQAFHSMVCGPKRAQRCIDSFSGAALFGSVSEYDDSLMNQARNDDNTRHLTNLQSLDYRYTAPYLTLGSYYLLVVFSLTGLCTLFGQTQCLQASQLSKNVAEVDLDSTGSDANSSSSSSSTTEALSKVVNSITMNTSGLQVRPEVFDYLLQESDIGQTKLKRGTTTTTTTTTNNNSNNKHTKATFTLDRIFEFDFGGAVTVLMIHVLVNKDDNKRHLVEVYRVNTDTWLGRIGSLVMSPLHFLSKLLNQAMEKTKTS